MTAILQTHGLAVGYDGLTVLTGVDLAIHQGELVSFVGRNGCGKSTLLRTMGRLQKPLAGSLSLAGEPYAAYGPKPFARRVASLPQSLLAPGGLSVRALVLRGRNPHQRFTAPWTRHDADVVDGVLAQIGLLGVADHPVAELSGGQRQRAWLGLVLAQEADVLLLDEPTTFLDLSHQLDVLDLVAQVARTGRTVVMVLHDLGLAARYADRLVVVHGGGIHASGRPDEVLTEPLLAGVFGLEARVVPDPVTGTPLVVPVRTSTGASSVCAHPDPHPAVSR